MSIANVGAFVKGAATGHRDAMDERRKEEDQQFQQEQRSRQKKEWATADAVQSQLAGIQRPGKYAEVGPSIDGMGPTRSGFEVSPQDYQWQVADVYARHGMLDKAAAAEDRGFTLGQQARTLREQDVNDAVLQAGRLRLTDPIGAMRVLTKASRGVVPGFDFEETVDPVTGATLVGYKNTRTGEWLEKPQPINAETVQRAIDEAFKWSSTQNWAKYTELGIRKQDADTNRQYREDSAENMREQRRLQEMGLKQQAAYQQGQLAIQRANAANAASSARMGQPIAFTDAQGNQQIGIPTMTRDGRVTVNPMVLPQGARLAPKVTGERDISFKDFMAHFAGAPSGIRDPKRGDAMVPVGELPPEQQMQVYNAFRAGGGRGAQSGGLPDVPPPPGGVQRPVIVQKGQSYMTAPGANIMGNPSDFLRESKRGMFGGVEYFYRDPVTNRTFTVEEYNQLLGGN